MKQLEFTLAIEEYLELLKNTQCLNWGQKYYMHWQIEALLFGNAELGSDTVTKLQYTIYHQILHNFMNEFDDLSFIPERNNGLVIVTVQQFLSTNHAPTQATLDRAFVLNQYLGQKVILINTAEFIGGEKIEILSGRTGNYNDALSKADYIEYKGVRFPFMQFENTMPNIFNSKEFIQFIKRHKPSYIVNIGSESLLIDTCSKLVPVLNISTVASDLTMTEATASVIGRKYNSSDNQLLSILGKSVDYLITGRFTFSLKEQTHHYTREQLHLPTNRFLLAVVGGRLTDEVTDTFIDMLMPALDAGAYLCIVGRMDNYNDFCLRNTIFKTNSTYLGYQKDILAVLELCDLYVNPKRKGGGTSVITAMYKGLPTVSLSYGDVALGAGTEFCVSNYKDMSDIILRYMSDSPFYAQMSDKAKARADYMLDSNTAFAEIIGEFSSRFLQQ